MKEKRFRIVKSLSSKELLVLLNNLEVSFTANAIKGIESKFEMFEVEKKEIEDVIEDV